jgi:hypothetical protein
MRSTSLFQKETPFIYNDTAFDSSQAILIAYTEGSVASDTTPHSGLWFGTEFAR